MYKLIVCFTGLLLLSACTFTTSTSREPVDENHETALAEMVAIDRAFSDSCEKNGMKKAFLEFVADDAVLLRPGYLPIVEGDVVKFLTSQEDTSFVMNWTPKGWHLSKSNDMGYTYGVYEIKMKANDSLINGTYVSIWQKQKDGQWKFVLDTGNPGSTQKVE
jgi:ketosteroid isomerase-like protein